MINLSICRKCRHGKIEPHRESEDGGLDVMPAVECGVGGELHMLLMNSDPPDGCPFDLEHGLTTQEVPKSFADRMSGERTG